MYVKNAMTKKAMCLTVLLASLLGAGLAGCDSILEPEPVGQIVVDNVYGDVSGAITGINAVYSPLASNGGYNESMWRLADLASDDGWTSRGADETVRFATDANHLYVQGMWSTSFECVARANVALAQVPDTPFPDDEIILKDAILGQALFLRALCYFNLVRFFGDVPLITTATSNPEEVIIARTPTEEVYAQIEQDLLDAAQMLPVKSALDGSRGMEPGRATSGAANALLSKVYLTQEKWTDAAEAAARVIDSDEYRLLEDYGNNFQGKNENSLESVFEIQYSSDNGATGAVHNNVFGPPELVQGSGFQTVIATNDTVDYGYPGDQGLGLVQAFEEGDARKSTTMSNYGLPSFFEPNSGKPRFLMPNKYFAGAASPSFNSSVNYPVMRYAEVLLIRAEALNEMGQTAEASVLVNQVRERAGLDPLSGDVTSSQELFRKAVWHERRVELAFESKRFFDLNRTGRLAERAAEQGIEISSAKIVEHPITGKPKYLYPIPATELANNANVAQNPGY